LPELALEAGYAGRDNQLGSSSESLITGSQSLEPSTSQERKRRTANSSLVWNLLDFGVSYAQAQQAGDDWLISGEKRRKVVQNIIQDVRYAYWRALGAQQLAPWTERIMARLDDALKRVDGMEESGILPPLTYLEYRRQLLEIRLQLWQLREDLESARAELAALINIPPGSDYRLAGDGEAPPIPQFDLPIETLERVALAQRPEVREVHYQRRINTLEVRKAMLRMLPGLEFEAGVNYDSNEFLYNNRWNSFGVRVNWNLFNLFGGQSRIDAAKAQVEVDKARSLALGMAVVTQIHLARLRYQTALQDYQVSSQLAEVGQEILDFNQAGQRAEIQDELQVISSEADGLLSRMNSYLSYAELQNAYGRLHNSVGLDPLPEALDGHDITTIADALQQQLASWQGRVQALADEVQE
jgi:outer membrane protein TolC